MTWRYLMPLAILVCAADLASAGILFNRKPKPSPQRAQELIGILASDASESKRAAAASELGDYDARVHPEIVPPLLQALRDASADVRVQAVQSLGKLRPVTQEIGMALELAQASDAATKVRLQARSTLVGYRVAGYRTAKVDAPAPTGQRTVTPPAPVAPQALPSVPQPLPSTPGRQEPPLAEPLRPQERPVAPRLTPVPTPKLEAPIAPQRLPTAPVLQPPTGTPPKEEGPILNAPM